MKFSFILMHNIQILRIMHHPDSFIQKCLMNILRFFQHEKEKTGGAGKKDRWGILMTSLVPLKDEEGKNACLAWHGHRWLKTGEKTVILNAMFPGTLTIILIFFIALLFMVNRNRLFNQEAIPERERNTFQPGKSKG